MIDRIIDENNIDEILESMRKRYNNREMIDRILRAYQYLGILIFLLSVIYAIYKFYFKFLDYGMRISFFIGTMGITLFISTYFFRFILNHKKSRNNNIQRKMQSVTDFLLEFILFEKTVRNYYGKDFENNTLSNIILQLFVDGMINEKEKIILIQLLKTRNEVVHLSIDISEEQSSMYIEYIEKILNRIKNNGKNRNLKIKVKT